MKTKFSLCLMILVFTGQAISGQTALGGLSTQLQGTQITGRQGEQTAGAATATTSTVPVEGDCTLRNTSYVVLRAEPKLESAQVATISASERFSVLERANGWAKVRTAKGTGYMRTHYVKDPKVADETPAATPAPASGASATGATASVSASAGSAASAGSKKKNIFSKPVFMRAGKSADANSPGVIPPGGDVVVLAVEGDWLLVESGGARGYVRSAYVGDQPPPATVTGRIQEPLRHPGDPVTPRPGIQPQNGQPAANPPAAHNPGPTASGGGLSGRPVAGGRVTSEFGMRTIFGRTSNHNGIDIGVPTGTPAVAVGNGKVAKVGYDTGGGKYIDIKYDNGYSSRYYHLKDTVVGQGARVTTGQTVCHTDNTGTMTTGAHLHAEFKDASGKFVNPRNIPGMKF